MTMAQRQIILVVLAFLAISETSADRSKKWRLCGKTIPTLSNGQVIQNKRNDIEYKCNTGFRLTASANCLKGRFWTPQVNCEEILCEDDPVINNGTLSAAIVSRSIGEKYPFTCNEGFTGMGNVVCNGDGIWDVSAECKECIALKNTNIVLETREVVVIDPATNCPERCNNETDCAFAIQRKLDTCLLFPRPVIEVSVLPSLNSCISACDANDACKLLLFDRTIKCILLSTNDLDSLKLESRFMDNILGRGCRF